VSFIAIQITLHWFNLCSAFGKSRHRSWRSLSPCSCSRRSRNSYDTHRDGGKFGQLPRFVFKLRGCSTGMLRIVCDRAYPDSYNLVLRFGAHVVLCITFLDHHDPQGLIAWPPCMGCVWVALDVHLLSSSGLRYRQSAYIHRFGP